MTVQLSSLRVSAEMDSQKYVAGANAKVAADRAMTASSQAVGQAVAQTDTKISQSGDMLARLSRQYVDGYANAQRMNSAVMQLSRGIETGKITMQQAEPILDGIFRKYGQLADGAQFAARGQHEFAAAIANTNARMAAQIAVANQASAATARMHSPANQNFNGTNAAFQVQDIAMMSLMGQAPMATALQQGPQLAMAIQQGGGIATLGAGLMSLLNPTMLITIGLTAATAAAIQFFSSTEEGSEEAQKSLDAYIKAVKDLDAAYGRAGNSAEELGRRSVLSLDAAESRTRRQAEKTLADQVQSLLGNTSNFSLGFIFPEWMRSGNVELVLEPFRSAIDELRDGMASGDPDFSRFQTRIAEISATDPDKLNLWRDVLFEMTDQAAALEKALEGVQDGLVGSQSALARADRDALANFQSQESIAAQRRQQAFDAETQQMLARSPAELAEAARAREAATYNGDESAQARRDRIELAGKRALIEAEHDLAEAQKERNRSLDATLANARLDIELIGQSTAETERLRMEHELLAQVRDEAARNGVAVDEAEIARIREKSAEYGKLRAIEDARSTIRGQQEQLESARAEITLMGETAEVRARVIEQIKVEQEIRQLGIDLYGAEANAMRANASALSDLADANAQLERTKETWESIFDTARDGIDSIVDSLFEGGQDIGEVLKNIGRDFARLMFDLAVTNPLKNWLTGSNLNSIADLGIFGSGASSGKGGGFGGVLGNLLGAQKAVASMQVQAASVFINGVPVGAGGLGSIAGMFGGGGAPSPFGTASGFADMLGLGTGTGASQSYIQDRIDGAFGSISQSMIQSRIDGAFSGLGSVGGGGGIASFASAIKAIESGGNYGALGPLTGGDRAYGAYQVMGANVGPWTKQALGKSMTPKEFLGSPGSQDAVFEKIFGGYADKYGPSGAAQAWFGGPGSVGKGGAGKDILGTSGSDYVNKFNDQLEKLGEVSSEVTGSLGMVTVSGVQVSQSLVSAAGGLNNFGSMLSSFMSSAMGGGSSWFQGLMGAFGGIGGALGHMNSISPGATAAIMGAGGGFVGLYDQGGYTGAGGRYEPAGVVHRGEFVFDAASTSRIGVSTLDAMRRMPGFAEGGYVAANRNMGHSNSNRPDSSFKIINVMDPRVVGDYLATPEGEQIVMNVMRRMGK